MNLTGTSQLILTLRTPRQMTLQLALLFGGELPEHVRTEELCEAIFTHV
jgi:hypothetical protein